MVCRAREFLADKGLTSGQYHHTLPDLDDGTASSSHLDLSNGALPDDVYCCVNGDQDVAKQLELTMNIDETKHATAASETLAELAGALCPKALGAE